jgi:ribosomal protein S3AE
LEGEKAQTEVIGYEVSPAAIKRQVRRSTTRIDESLVFETADKKRVVIKLFLVTKAIVRSSTARTIRNALPELLKKEISNASYENLVKSLISNKLQMGLKNQLKMIYPIRNCEVKSMRLVQTEKSEQKTAPEQSQKLQATKAEK